MTPVEFLRQYHELTVEYLNPHLSSPTTPVHSLTQVKVRTYLSTASNPCPNEVDGVLQTEEELRICREVDHPREWESFLATKATLNEKDLTLPAKDKKEERQAVNRAFNGKGSPEDIALTLSWAVEKGRCEANPTAIQKYCDDWLGMDCNGLTDRYFQKENSWEPHRYLSGSTGRNGVFDIQVDDVMVWCKANGNPFTMPPDRHIGLVQGIQFLGVSYLGGQRRLAQPEHAKGKKKSAKEHQRLSAEFGAIEFWDYSFAGINVGPRIHVVESTGSLGPVESSYPVIDQWQGNGGEIVFRVRRPLKGGSSFVRVAKPNLPKP